MEVQGGVQVTRYLGDNGLARTSRGGGGCVREEYGERVCSEWPILFMALDFSILSLPSESNAPGWCQYDA